MKIYFHKIRVKYYRAAIYIFGLSFFIMSGCRSNSAKVTNTQDTIMSQKKDDTHTEYSLPDTSKAATISDTSKIIKKSKKVSPPKIAPTIIIEPQPEYGVRYQDYKELKQAEPEPIPES